MPDQLLYTISTIGRISLSKFYSAYDDIQASQPEHIETETSNSNKKRIAVRLLDALGHCEFDFEKRMVYACPPFLVALPSSGLPNAVLTGARTPSLISKIVEFITCNKDSISIRCVKQEDKGYLLPQAIFIEAVDNSILKILAETVNIGHKLDTPAAWSFADFSLEIEDIKNNLSFDETKDPTWYRETFSKDYFSISKHNNKCPPDGLVCYSNPCNQQFYHFIWENGRASRVDRYWGRYIILADNGMNILLYDFRRNLLAVPSNVPLPRILGRAATLCSGLAPESIELDESPIKDLPNAVKMDVFISVPPPIARMISKKLSQTLIPYNITLEDE